MLRELRVDDDLWRGADGARGEATALYGAPSIWSLTFVDVDDAVDATDAVWARRRESSRVRRFTCRVVSWLVCYIAR